MTFLNSSEAVDIFTQLVLDNPDEEEDVDSSMKLTTMAMDYISFSEIVSKSLWNYTDDELHEVVNVS